MSQSPNSALDLAIAKAAEEHQAAEQALALARGRLRAAETTYATLSNFNGEYEGRLRGVNRLSKDSLGNYHRFLDKLALALDSQRNDVDQAGQAVAQQKTAWFASLRRLKAMELLRERRAAAARTKIMRLEQKQSDEFAARSSRRKQHETRYEQHS